MGCSEAGVLSGRKEDVRQVAKTVTNQSGSGQRHWAQARGKGHEGPDGFAGGGTWRPGLSGTPLWEVRGQTVGTLSTGSKSLGAILM